MACRHSSEKLLELGRELHARLGGAFTGDRFCREAGVSMPTIRRRFGHWQGFRGCLGLGPIEDDLHQNPSPTGRRYSEARLMELAREAIPALGEYMRMTDFSRHSGVSCQTILKRFGSWEAFRERAGLPPSDSHNWKNRRHTRESVLEKLRQVADRCGPNLTQIEFCRRSGISSLTFYRFFSSWSEAREAVDLPPHARPRPRYTDDFVLADLTRVARSCQRFPTPAEYRTRGRLHIKTVLKRFGPTWRDVEHRHAAWVEYQQACPPLPPGVRPFSDLTDEEKLTELRRLMSEADAAP